MDNQEEDILKCYKYSKDQTINEERTFKQIKYIAAGSEGFVSLYKPINWCFKVDEVAIKKQKFTRKESIEFHEKLLEQQNKLEKSQDEKSSIIRIYELCQIQQSEFIIIMEKGGYDLYEYQKYNKELTFQQKGQICLQIAQAVKQLHQLGYIHRDIKPENFVLVNDGFKLIDFGLTKQTNELEMSMDIGSIIFQAPEVLIGDGHYTSSIDIWSLGCAFYELFAHNSLLDAQSQHDAQQKICNHIANQNFIYGRIAALKIQQEWKDLIQNMLHPLPNERITSEKLVIKIRSLLNIPNKQFFQTVQNIDRLGTPHNGMVKNPLINNGLPPKIVFQTINASPMQTDKPQFNCLQTPNQNLANSVNVNQQQIQCNFSIPTDPKVPQTTPQFASSTNNNNQPQKVDQKAIFNTNQNEMYEILSKRVQKLESEFQNVKQEMADLKNEVTELKGEKASLLDQNNKMKTQIQNFVQQQYTSLDQFKPFLKQTQQA